MRSLHTITTPIIRSARARSFDRRRVQAVHGSLTVLCLFKHDETDTQIYVSHNDDPLCAVWIKKQPLLIDPRFCGRFVIITIPNILAREKHLAAMPILDFEKYLPEERKQLQAAIDAAYRARQRHRGVQPSSMGYMGRNVFA